MTAETELTAKLPLPENERAVIEKMLALAAEEGDEALELSLALLKNHPSKAITRGESASVARCITAFLLHRQRKSQLVSLLREQTELCEAIFGELNTYKYSMIFMLRRVMHSGDEDSALRILRLIKENPYRDDLAKDYSEKWSYEFILRELSEDSGEYLRLSDAFKSVLEEEKRGAQAVPTKIDI